MIVSAEGLNFIKRFEGVHNRPYRCSAGLWTVGVGHLIGNGKLLPKDWNRIFSEKEINDLLAADIRKFERGVGMYIKVPLRQCEFDAICSFAFNLGLGTLQRSTLRQKINRGDKKGAAENLLRYCYAGGKVVRGLQIRREAEYKLFMR